MLRISLAGATGYAGSELLRILANHPEVKIVHLTSETFAGQSYAEVLPAFQKVIDADLVPLDPSHIGENADLVFTALPHRTAMQAVPKILEAEARVIDFSADYRLHDPSVYTTWYGTEHIDSDRLQKAVYGLPELYRDQIKDAHLVANPGCYPTGAILALAPLLRDRLVAPDSIIVDSKSGVSGAGRQAEAEYSYCELNDNVKAYSIAVHRHTPEIEQELSASAGTPVTVSFTPHLIPMSRGILTTCYASIHPGASVKELWKSFQGAYEKESFVRLMPAGQVPTTGQVRGSNFTDLGFVLDERTGRVIVVTALDNLAKGAAGAAVQNMNVMAGFQETTALSTPGISV